MKHFVADEISVPVSFFLEEKMKHCLVPRQLTKQTFSLLADILPVAPHRHIVKIFMSLLP
jgi:hypothetical protein